MAKRLCDQNRRSNHCCWSDLPIDQLREVADRLSYIDFLRFGIVCKQWRRASLDDDDGKNKIQRRRAMFMLEVARCSDVYYSSRTESRTISYTRFFDLSSNFQLGYYRKVWEDEGIQSKENRCGNCCCSYSDWLLFVKSETSPNRTFLLVLDPFYDLTQKVQVPPLDWNYGYNRSLEVAAFSTAPTSLDCVIFVVWRSRAPRGIGEGEGDEGEGEEDHYFTITTYNLRYRRWSIDQLPCVNPDDCRFKDVVYASGSFYCAIVMNSKVVLLGTFNVALQK